MNFILEEQLGVKIAKVRNSIRNAMEQALFPYDITTTQYVVLLKLCQKDRMTQKELSNEITFKQSAITLILDKLESKELVERVAKKSDRRAYIIAITKKGKELESILKSVAKDVEKRATLDIPQKDRDIFVATLDKILDNLNN